MPPSRASASCPRWGGDAASTTGPSHNTSGLSSPGLSALSANLVFLSTRSDGSLSIACHADGPSTAPPD